MTEPEREQIRLILLSAGVDNITPTIDGKTELEWMTESCPSLAHAMAEAARRRDRTRTLMCADDKPI
jgi:hypothetical protein